MPIIYDLIYTEEEGGKREMSVAVIGDGKDKLLGPVASVGAIKPLAAMLFEYLPEQFKNLSEAENRLSLIHFRNMTAGENSAGQSYPYKVGA